MTGSIKDLMEPEFLETSEGAAKIRFRIRPDFRIPSGALQGGMVTVMLDMTMAIAGAGMISTASLHLEILRPVTEDTVVVDGRIVRRGRRIVFAEAEMHTEDGKLLARATQTAVPV